MAAWVQTLLLLLVIGVRAALFIEVDDKLDLWDDWAGQEYENEVEPRPRPEPQQVADVQVVVPIDSAAPSAGGDFPDVPVYVPVSVVTPSTRKPVMSHSWKQHGSFAPTTTAAKDVPVYVPIANSGGGNKMRPKVPVGDVPVIIGTSGVKHENTEGREKTVPVVIPININISSGKGDKSRPPLSDVPVIVGTGHRKPSTTTTTPTTSTVPPDVPVVVGLKLGPQFHRRSGAAPPGHLPSKRFWLPPVVGFVPRPLLLPPIFRPQPWQPLPPPPPRPASPAPIRPTATTAAPINVDGKLDFSEA